MSVYFNSFTPEAMHALGAGLAAARQQRQELLGQVRSQTHALLAAAREKRAETAAARRESAAHEADARRLFTSELQSEVHALRNRFELARRDTVTDLQNMAVELHAAREAVRAWPGRSEAKPARRPARPAAPAVNTHANTHAHTATPPAKAHTAAPAPKPHAAPAAKPHASNTASASGSKQPPFRNNPDPDKGRHG